MTVALHLPTRTIGAPASSSPRRRLSPSTVVAAIGAAAAALVLTLHAEPPRSAVASIGVPPLAPLETAATAVPAFALEVDWSRVEAAEDPGPLAVAAYGP